MRGIIHIRSINTTYYYYWRVICYCLPPNGSLPCYHDTLSHVPPSLTGGGGDVTASS
ncbi:uncharacterized protein LACBIDRAFT_318738 [Laccaria bicolor S238N-H82]|uniref:Predicted protein n=1 Tax=Laccaria bicolor (strain S238N-H82 / ATCC MYA-4686) TaxID=486041 RepID=B0D6Y5_LACBS|nr:uncharacterized protein LACBIDRAFT_318738 [Laccaria bicolor S238N-H82]EDR09305.1 predicted protein [Laccaria bicolor S238N-H82]|eukprot:XP_001879654.1 predicted protein [Laccaria bicolor S238N-H82]